MSDAPSILSLRLTRIYGARSEPAPALRATPPAPAPQDTTRGPSNAIRDLIAAHVPGRIAFDETSGHAAPARDAIPMYRRPADRNAAAVAIELGRSIDVRG